MCLPGQERALGSPEKRDRVSELLGQQRLYHALGLLASMLSGERGLSTLAVLLWWRGEVGASVRHRATVLVHAWR